ncbi:MAG: hypothetical protein WCA10_22325 [Terracidiphilus sp.]
MQNWKTLGVLAVMSFGFAAVGCKSAPDLTPTQALALVQAKYDQTPPVATTVLVNETGIRAGVTAKLWERTKVYPNKLWADFKLTPEGKKAVTLPGGGDVIEWRPENQADTNYTVVVMTVVANHLRAHDMDDLQDEMLAGSGTAKEGKYTEGVNLTGVPQVLDDIAHNPGNKLSTKKQADFALENGTWVLKSIE